MGDQYLDLILFAMIAGFLILRLRSVLGRRTGTERPPDAAQARIRPVGTPDNVVPMADRYKRDAAPAAGRAVAPVDGNPLQAGLDTIRANDPNFRVEAFTGGARAAFETIVHAFAAGDTATLRPLLSDEVYDTFAQSIRERMAAKEALETKIMRLEDPKLVEAHFQGRTASLTVQFVSEQVNVTRDHEGEVVDGAVNEPVERTDFWTFSRNVRSLNPNWILVGTGAPQ